MFDHRDTLGRLNDHIPLREKLITAHNSIKELFPFVARIAVTIYDPQTSVLKTFLHSSDDGDPMQHYQASLDDAPSLKEILKQGLPRVVNNLVTFEGGEHEHTRRIGRQGYAASYTMPMFNDGVFVGFLFFNSYDRDVFTEHVLREIDVYGHMIALMVINELTSIRTLTAAVQTTGHITHVRDAETGSHLDRMSRYCRLIATALAPKYLLDDDYIEHVFMFSPLHDIGKIGIPDRILLKPDKLNDEEWEIMKTHARKGREMIDKIVSNFGRAAQYRGTSPRMRQRQRLSGGSHTRPDTAGGAYCGGGGRLRCAHQRASLQGGVGQRARHCHAAPANRRSPRRRLRRGTDREHRQGRGDPASVRGRPLRLTRPASPASPNVPLPRCSHALRPAYLSRGAAHATRSLPSTSIIRRVRITDGAWDVFPGGTIGIADQNIQKQGETS